MSRCFYVLGSGQKKFWNIRRQSYVGRVGIAIGDFAKLAAAADCVGVGCVKTNWERD